MRTWRRVELSSELPAAWTLAAAGARPPSSALGMRRRRPPAWRDGGTGDARTGRSGRRPPRAPGGGREIFPRAAWWPTTAPRTTALGTLGIGSPAAAAARLRKTTAAYDRPERPVLPAFELIATVATFDPGRRRPVPPPGAAAVIDRYLEAARAIGALLHPRHPARARGLPAEARRLERWLLEPDVVARARPGVARRRRGGARAGDRLRHGGGGGEVAPISTG